MFLRFLKIFIITYFLNQSQMKNHIIIDTLAQTHIHNSGSRVS